MYVNGKIRLDLVSNLVDCLRTLIVNLGETLNYITDLFEWLSSNSLTWTTQLWIIHWKGYEWIQNRSICYPNGITWLTHLIGRHFSLWHFQEFDNQPTQFEIWNWSATEPETAKITPNRNDEYQLTNATELTITIDITRPFGFNWNNLCKLWISIRHGR